MKEIELMLEDELDDPTKWYNRVNPIVGIDKAQMIENVKIGRDCNQITTKRGKDIGSAYHCTASDNKNVCLNGRKCPIGKPSHEKDKMIEWLEKINNNNLPWLN